MKGHPDLESLSLIAKGVSTWNSWRRSNPFLIPQLMKLDLSERDLRGIDLSNAEMSGALLDRANLSGANLYQAELFEAKLARSSLISCDMRGAKLHEADLTDADLTGADLYRADFIGTKIAGANFSDARCDTTAFSRVDLCAALNLDHVVHTGPSNIDVLTLSMAVKNLPVGFLQAAGIPAIITDYLPSLVGGSKPVEYFSCFISYSHHDEEFSRHLFQELRARGVQVWFAPEDLKRGRKIHEQIDEAIHLHDKLLLVLSQHSLASNWVQSELRKTLRREAREDRRMLFPISLISIKELREWECFDADSGRDIATEVREYFIPDFSGWENRERFEKAVEALIGDLQRA